MKAADLPLHYNAVDILERNLPERAAKVALLSDARTVTFGEMAADVDRTGHALAGLGVRRGDTVAILALDSAEWVASYFAVIKLGGVVASFNTLLTPAEFQYMLNDCGARVIVLDASLLPAIESIRPRLDWLEHIVVIAGPTEHRPAQSAGPTEHRPAQSAGPTEHRPAQSAGPTEHRPAQSAGPTEHRPAQSAGPGHGHHDYAALVAAAPAEKLAAARTHRDDFCCLNYSSGTTGEPKGILHQHKDLPLTAELVGVRTLGLRSEDRTFAVAKLFFTFGTGGNLIFPWWVGASIVLYPGSPRQARNVLGMIDRFKPTVFYTAPTGYASMLAESALASEWDLSSLRLCVSAGEALPAPIWHRWKEATGLEIIDGIGSTENYHMFIANRPGDVRPGSSGRPIEGYQVRIVDEAGRDAVPGQVGNLLVRGETAALLYLHQYDRSRRTFQGEWLDTGDKYTVDEEGVYWHAGRSDDMLKVGGIWVSPVEVESCLLGHPDVAECAVVGHADAAGLVKPKAFVVIRTGASAERLADRLLEHCAASMAHYKRPRWIELVDDLPKTATGKVQRFRLR